MKTILAVLVAPGGCSRAAGLRVGMGMATRHPGVWRGRMEPCDRAQEIHATTCHTGCRQSRGDSHVRLIAKGPALRCLGLQGSQELQLA